MFSNKLNIFNIVHIAVSILYKRIILSGINLTVVKQMQSVVI